MERERDGENIHVQVHIQEAEETFLRRKEAPEKGLVCRGQQMTI